MNKGDEDDLKAWSLIDVSMEDEGKEMAIWNGEEKKEGAADDVCEERERELFPILHLERERRFRRGLTNLFPSILL